MNFGRRVSGFSLLKLPVNPHQNRFPATLQRDVQNSLNDQ
ncbi:replication protein RepA (plasmid) [Escherichia coli]|nr:replication protein RepA [Escherichia coli]